ncbi:MAG: chorismate mutase [Eubacterium sp.]|nr:chorismate mutase [Eubacterium sp.]
MTLDEIRHNIDRVDKEIKALFQERMELADQVAQVKAQTGDNIFKPDREIAIIDRLTTDIEPDIKKEYIALIKRIMEVSRKYQYGRTLELRNCLDLTWLTEEPSLSQIAMKKSELYICNMVSKDLVTTVDEFAQVGQLIQNKQVDAGIGILEDVSISASKELHSLLVGEHLYINRCDIVNDSGVRKKVVLFSPHLVVLPDHNRIKIMFVCRNKSGSIASIFSMISDYNVNLTEIHSQPNEQLEWNYEFYAEIEANLLSKETQALIFQLMNETYAFQILGSYNCEGDF